MVIIVYCGFVPSDALTDTPHGFADVFDLACYIDADCSFDFDVAICAVGTSVLV